MTVARTSDGSRCEFNIRQMIFAEIPVLLCAAARIVYAVLRGNPSAVACTSSESDPVATSASPISRIFDDCRAFRSAIEIVTELSREAASSSAALSINLQTTILSTFGSGAEAQAGSGVAANT